MNVLYLSDDNYAVFMGVSITSLLTNNTDSQSISIYIIDDGISIKHREELTKLVESYGREICFLDLSRRVSELQQLGAPSYRGSYTTYLKLFAFNDMPDSVHRLVFIDSDTIVNSSLRELDTISMENNTILAVKEGLCGDYKKALGVSSDAPWYNMGMMVVDIDQWKNDKYEDVVLSQLRKNARFVSVDQDILNLCFSSTIGALNPRYNMTPHYCVYSFRHLAKLFNLNYLTFYDEEVIVAAKQSVAIYHFERFVGSSPWDLNSLHPFTPQFDEYLLCSPWYYYEKQKRDIPYVLRFEQLLYKLLPREVFLSLFSVFYKRYFTKSYKVLSETSSRDISI